MVAGLVTVILVAAVATVGLGWALGWPPWRPLDLVFEPLARQLPRPLSPERLQHRILRLAAAHISVGVSGGIMAPTAYEVRIGPEDMELLGGMGDWFSGELAGALAETVTKRGGSLRRPPTVELVTDETRPRSRPVVEARFEAPTQVVGPEWDPHGPTMAPEHTAIAGGWVLVPVDGTDGDGEAIPLTGNEIVVGRSRSADIRLDDRTVSARHARLRPRADGHWEVADLGSTNGTRLNGGSLHEPAPLASGDQLRIGAATWRVEQR